MSDTQDSKTCPNCQKINSLQNLNCVKCGYSLINVQSESFWNEDNKTEHFPSYGIGIVFYEILLSLTFFICILMGFYSSKLFFIISILLLIYMIKNDYVSFLKLLIRRRYR